jgi:methylmalonyl-CoA/ethylmalonyl-CoA epimerase
MSDTVAQMKTDLPPLHHVGIVVLDLEAASADFERRWGAQVTDVTDVTWPDALYHGRRRTITLRRGVISTGGSDIELIEPIGRSPFHDSLVERKGDGVHHLAYVVDDIDLHLGRLKPTCAELILDAHLAEDGSRMVCVDGFAHGPTIELIQRTAKEEADD